MIQVRKKILDRKLKNNNDENKDKSDYNIVESLNNYVILKDSSRNEV